MDPARQLDRFGRDGDHGPLVAPLAHVTLSRATGTAADREVLLGFPSSVDALTFADWWGAHGAAAFAAYLDAHRIPLTDRPT